MSGIELAGLILGSVPVLLTAGFVSRDVEKKLKKYHQVYTKDGIIPVLLLGLLPDASATLDRLESALSKADTDFLSVRALLVSNLNMISVAVSVREQYLEVYQAPIHYLLIGNNNRTDVQ